MYFRFLICIAFICFCSIVQGQPWIDAAKKTDGSYNFFEVQKQFEAYWKDRPQERSKGIKPYKRWAYYWESRVDSRGNFPPADIKKKEWENYTRSVRKSIDGSRAGAWTSLGPNSTAGGYAGTGRVSAVAFHPSDANTIFIGTPGGGLWRSTNNGDSWTPLTDNILSHLGISGIVIHPTTPNIMYIATGDGDGYNTYSLGVFKSTDSGVTWNTTGLNWAVTNFRVIRKMIIDPDDSNTLLVASNAGIYRTTNSGTTWSQVASGDFYDIVAHPSAVTNTFYASTSNQVYRSTDNGINFSVVHTVSGSGRINLAVTAANSNYIYALSAKSADGGYNGLYRSTNSGNTFTTQSTIPNILGYQSDGSDAGGQGWYDLCVTADPQNADIVYIGGVNTWKSSDGGANWILSAFWYSIPGYATVHADKHVFSWQNNTTLWNGNDGGIYRTSDGGSTWTDKSNTLVHSQIYRIGASQSDNKVIGGLQDNGTKMKSAAGIWSDVMGGDGMECNIHPTNSNIQYGCSQNGALRRTTNNWSGSTDIRNNISMGLQGAWITPHEIDPTTPTTIYAAYQSLYKSTNQGTSWTEIGTQAQLGSENKTILKIAPSNSNVIYVGKNNAIYRTEDGGTSWTALNLPGTDISSLTIHPTKPLTIWISRSNYLAGQKVFRSFDGGANWTNESRTLPNLPVNVILHNNQLEESVYIGMDVGIFYVNNELTDWVPFSDGLPNVEVFDLDIRYSSNTIYAATYGRGLWSSTLFVPTSPSCNAAINVAISPGYQSVNVSWEPYNISAASAYEIAVTTNSNPPVSGLITTDPNYLVTGLSDNTTYYFHIRTNCTNDTKSIWKSYAFKTPASCGFVYMDSGGNSGNYSSNEDITTTICAKGTNGASNVTATFVNPFNVETDWDALYVHNGVNINAPLIASGNPATNSGFPAGGYYGSVVPGPFTASNSSGCLTMRFRSDDLYEFSGYITNPITCSAGCTNVVTSISNSGANTLRDIVSCLASGSNIFFDASINGQTILLSSPIVLNKNLRITGAFNSSTKISASGANGIFDISTGFNVTLENLEITTSSANVNAILNNGNLVLRNVTFKDPESMTGNSVLNQGTITVKDKVNINKF